MAPDFLAHLRAESERFARVLVATDPAATVPTCPEWTAADLLWHLGEVQLFWGAIVEQRLSDPDQAENVQPDRPSDYDALLAFFLASSSFLTDALAGTSDDTAVWTWFPSDQTAGFVRRRQAHEALIHRLDAEVTAGTVTDIDPDLATDGVKEVLDWMYSFVPEWATLSDARQVGRVATIDTDASWLVRVGAWSGTSPNSGKSYSNERVLTVVESGEPSFEVTGAARDMDAWLWNRPTWSEVRLEGDTAGFAEAIRSGVQ
ncbi:MAG TPA: maleylpyruvate isomerase family mycothiol-dependent enzyme [Jatrophihabitans sp.]|jgi:uncharacterized protein (TIGR03083 family)